VDIVEASASKQASEETDLASFGYTQQLHRTIGSYTSFALAFSMISVTTTVFTLFAEPFQAIGGIAIWLWIPVGAGVLLTTLVYGHLAARLPVTGYAYQWASRIVSPHFGWFTGWNAMLCTLVGSAGISVSLASVFAPDIWSSPTHWDIALLAVVAIVVAVTINLLSIKAAGRVNNAGATMELFGTLGFTLVLAFGLFFFHHIQGPKVLFQHGSSTGSGIGFDTIGLALLLPIWTLAGWEGSADLAEETNDPRRTAPRAMLRAVVISGAAAFVIYAVFAMAISGSIAHTVDGTSNPMVAIFSDHFGGFASDLLQIVAFIAMLSCLLANIACATRTSFSLSRDNMLPFSRIWSHVNPRTATPVYTIVAVGVFAIIINLLSGGFVTNVLAVVNVALYLTYGSTCVAVLIAHRNGRIPDAPAGYFGLGRWLVPVTVTCLVFCVAVIVFMIGPASSHVVLIYAAGFEAAGLVWYLAAVRRRINRGEAGPVLVAATAPSDTRARLCGSRGLAARAPERHPFPLGFGLDAGAAPPAGPPAPAVHPCRGAPVARRDLADVFLVLVQERARELHQSLQIRNVTHRPERGDPCQEQHFRLV
jgi:amino acid transporter